MASKWDILNGEILKLKDELSRLKTDYTRMVVLPNVKPKSTWWNWSGECPCKVTVTGIRAGTVFFYHENPNVTYTDRSGAEQAMPIGEFVRDFRFVSQGSAK